MINRAHASHLGMQYTTGTTREIMYWRRMTTYLNEAVARMLYLSVDTVRSAERTNDVMPHSTASVASSSK